MKQEVPVRTSSGIYRGVREDGVCSWKGIPYGKPLTPARRFSSPQAPAAWKKPLDALDYSGSAPQRSMLSREFSEDCLTLNIWSPEADDAARPVLFFIHGGALNHGSSSDPFYDGAYLAGHWDIVVVTINYRLGVLGFLDFSILDQRFSSNCGIRDVCAALEWVYEHIGAFGGDQENITVMGQSAGGTIVSALSVMPSVGTYIAKAVMMSGGPTQLQGIEECRSITRWFLEYAGISHTSQLTSIDLDDLMKLQREFISVSGLGSATFRISVDHDLIPEYPIARAAAGRGGTMPFLIGTTREEMAFIRFRPLERFVDASRIIEAGMDLEDEETRRDIRNGYYQLYGETEGRIMIYTDLLFRLSSVWFAQVHASHAPVWMYRFDYKTTALRINRLQAFHATDIPYMFGNFDSLLVKPMFILERDMTEVRQIARAMQQDLVQFMRTGTCSWKQCSPNEAQARCYDHEIRMVPAMAPRILELYGNSEYRKRSFTPGMNPAPFDGSNDSYS